MIDIGEAVMQFLLQFNGCEKLLNDHQSCKRRECLVFKIDIGQSVHFTIRFRFAIFHVRPFGGSIIWT
jgi:hypothetical protein